MRTISPMKVSLAMFADPQTVNAQTLPRTGMGLDTGQFRTGDGLHGLKVSHQYNKRSRHVVRYDLSKIAADPFTAGQSIRFSASAYLVVDAPKDGFTNAELVTMAAALLTNLSASTNANLTKVIAGES